METRGFYLVAAATAVVTAVAVPIEDKENENDDPNVGIVKNVAEASHGITILSVSFKRSVLPPFDTILCPCFFARYRYERSSEIKFRLNSVIIWKNAGSCAIIAL